MHTSTTVTSGVRGLVATALVALTVTACSSTGADVPADVERAFQARHPEATPVWEVQPYGYEAAFDVDGVEYEVEFSRSAQWLETEYEVYSDAALPPAVVDRRNRDYPGAQVVKREIEQTPTGEFYEFEVSASGSEGEIYYDGGGAPAQNSHEDA